ncbi:hypothetical protein [Pontibacillus salipaludis]|uniref:hypothetical protein n=1 Tax=Pontibacillus salipaludis TaxID=1697394 RepID=UPI0031F09623
MDREVKDPEQHASTSSFENLYQDIQSLFRDLESETDSIDLLWTISNKKGVIFEMLNSASKEQKLTLQQMNELEETLESLHSSIKEEQTKKSTKDNELTQDITKEWERGKLHQKIDNMDEVISSITKSIDGMWDLIQQLNRSNEEGVCKEDFDLLQENIEKTVNEIKDLQKQDYMEVKSGMGKVIERITALEKRLDDLEDLRVLEIEDQLTREKKLQESLDRMEAKLDHFVQLSEDKPLVSKVEESVQEVLSTHYDQLEPDPQVELKELIGQLISKIEVMDAGRQVTERKEEYSEVDLEVEDEPIMELNHNDNWFYESAKFARDTQVANQRIQPNKGIPKVKRSSLYGSAYSYGNSTPNISSQRTSIKSKASPNLIKQESAAPKEEKKNQVDKSSEINQVERSDEHLSPTRGSLSSENTFFGNIKRFFTE